MCMYCQPFLGGDIVFLSISAAGYVKMDTLRYLPRTTKNYVVLCET